MAIEVLAIGSDNLVRLDALANFSSGAFINSATVSFVLKDASGTVILNTTSMPYVAASNGRYEGTVPYSQSLTKDAMYTIEVTAQGGGYTLFRKLSAIAKYRSDK